MKLGSTLHNRDGLGDTNSSRPIYEKVGNHGQLIRQPLVQRKIRQIKRVHVFYEVPMRPRHAP